MRGAEKILREDGQNVYPVCVNDNQCHCFSSGGHYQLTGYVTVQGNYFCDEHT